MTTVGKRIKRFRYEKDMKQATLAETVGVTQGAISSWERGIAQPDYKMLFKIASALGTTPTVLLGGTSPPPVLSAYTMHVQFVPVIQDVTQDISANNITTLAPFPEGGHREVFGYKLKENHGSYVAGDMVFVSKQAAYHDTDQVMLVEDEIISITEFKRRNKGATVVGAIVGFYRARADN